MVQATTTGAKVFKDTGITLKTRIPEANTESDLGNDTEIDNDRLEVMETVVLNKLDKFLSKFESRLSHMEKYLSKSVSSIDNNNVDLLKYDNDKELEKEADQQEEEEAGEENEVVDQGESGNDEYSIISPATAAYSILSSTLTNIKAYLYKNQQHNIHPLTKIIDDFYEQEKLNNDKNLYKINTNNSINEINDDKINTDKNNDTLTKQKIMHTIQLLNARLTDFEKHYNLPSISSHPSERLIALKETLYNYDIALTMSNYRNLTFYELPFQWRENKFIVYGYRFARSHLMAMTSLFSWHNETINIWTHLLGGMYLIYLSIYKFPKTECFQIYGPTFNDHLINYLFLLSAIACLFFSSIWHSYTNIGFLSIRSKFACFDYSGITILITSSIITTEHISLKNYPNLRLIFIGFSIFAGLFGIGMAWHPYFDKPESRIIRILFFISLSGLGFASFFCCCILNNLKFAFNLFSPLCKSFVWYLLGVLFYGSLFPECFRSDIEIDNFEISDETIIELDKEGKLLEYLRKKPVHTCNKNHLTSLWWIDWIGNSHNLWHLFVIGGIIGHYYAIMEMFKRAYYF